MGPVVNGGTKEPADTPNRELSFLVQPSSAPRCIYLTILHIAYFSIVFLMEDSFNEIILHLEIVCVFATHETFPAV